MPSTLTPGSSTVTTYAVPDSTTSMRGNHSKPKKQSIEPHQHSPNLNNIQNKEYTIHIFLQFQWINHGNWPIINKKPPVNPPQDFLAPIFLQSQERVPRHSPRGWADWSSVTRVKFSLSSPCSMAALRANKGAPTCSFSLTAGLLNKGPVLADSVSAACTRSVGPRAETGRLSSESSSSSDWFTCVKSVRHSRAYSNPISNACCIHSQQSPSILLKFICTHCPDIHSKIHQHVQSRQYASNCGWTIFLFTLIAKE